MMKTKILFSLTVALLTFSMSFAVFAAQDPSFGSTYHPTEEIMADFGASEVSIPYSEYDSGIWAEVDNSFKFLMIDGTLEKDAKIFTEAGSTLVPVRLVSEKLGADVAYDATEKKITIIKEETELILFSGNKQAFVNGEEQELGAAVKNDGGTTYVPIRFVVENLGGEADYLAGDEYAVATFPTVVIDSAEFLALERMSEDEAVAAAKEKLLAAYDEFEEYITSGEFIGLPENLDEVLAELEADMENTKSGGKYASCYIKLECEMSNFIIDTITGDFYTLSYMTYTTKLRPFDFYDIGNGYLYN